MVVTGFTGISLGEKTTRPRHAEGLLRGRWNGQDANIGIQGERRDVKVARILTEARFRPVFAGLWESLPTNPGKTESLPPCKIRRKRVPSVWGPRLKRFQILSRARDGLESTAERPFYLPLPLQGLEGWDHPFRRAQI